MKVHYELHLLPINREDGSTASLTITGDTGIVSQRIVGNAPEPFVEVLTRTDQHDEDPAPTEPAKPWVPYDVVKPTATEPDVPDPAPQRTHTRTEAPGKFDPDYCAECSKAAGMWVQWPCTAATWPDSDPDPAPQGRWVVDDGELCRSTRDGQEWVCQADLGVTDAGWDALVELVRRANQPDPTAEQVRAQLDTYGWDGLSIDHIVWRVEAARAAAVAALREGQ